MSDEYYAQQQHQQRLVAQQMKSYTAAQRQGPPPVQGPGRACPGPDPGTIAAGLLSLGERLALAWELLQSLEEHLDPVLAHVPVQEHQWPLALEPTCPLAQQIADRLDQVQHLTTHLSALLERLAL